MAVLPLLTRAVLVLSGAGAVVLALSGPALADTPVGWEPTSTMSLVEALLIFGGGAAVLVLLISAAVVAPSLVRGARRDPGLDWWQEPQWFGGELEASRGNERAALEAASGTRPGGGASARW